MFSRRISSANGCTHTVKLGPFSVVLEASWICTVQTCLVRSFGNDGVTNFGPKFVQIDNIRRGGTSPYTNLNNVLCVSETYLAYDNCRVSCDWLIKILGQNRHIMPSQADSSEDSILEIVGFPSSLDVCHTGRQHGGNNWIGMKTKRTKGCLKKSTRLSSVPLLFEKRRICLDASYKAADQPFFLCTTRAVAVSLFQESSRSV